jgi:hypothetical protein
MKVEDETAADLAQLIGADIASPPADPDKALIAWLHYKARQVPQRPRTVKVSTEVQGHLAAYPAIAKIAAELRAGSDVTPWLHDAIRKRPGDPKADLMFNDWQILHFHLGNFFTQPNKVQRSGDLLFAHVTADRATLLDVQPHGAWAMRALLGILLRESPADMTRWELKGVVGLERNLTDAEILTLRSAGVACQFELNGRFFMSPGGGVTSAGTAGRFTHALIQIRRTVASAVSDIQQNKMPDGLLRALSSTLALPVKLGIKYQKDGRLVLIEKNRNLTICLFDPLE